MNMVSSRSGPVRLALRGCMAKDLMTPGPVSIRDNLTVREAVRFLIDKKISGAPVIDAAGHPIGVLTRSDLLLHRWVTSTPVNPDLADEPPDEIAEDGESVSSFAQLQKRWTDLRLGRLGETLVASVMTPVVYTVGLHAPAAQIIRDLCSLDVHRLFVIDKTGVLVGVITSLDVLRGIVTVRDVES